MTTRGPSVHLAMAKIAATLFALGLPPGLAATDAIEPLPEAIRKVEPVYPDSARRAGIQGTVVVMALVGKDGRVRNTRVVQSVQGLDDAAVIAVKQWLFKPVLANGQPVSAWVSVPVRFGPGQPVRTVTKDSLPAVTLLPPSAFPQLPAQVRSALEARRCRIPKAEGGCNVFRGEFERRGQRDWVVFCSTDSFSSLLVFWSGSPKRLEEVSRGPALRAGSESGPCFYSRAGPSTLRHFLNARDGNAEVGPLPRGLSVTHDGIEERQADCCSEFLYRHQGKWVRLPGMD